MFKTSFEIIKIYLKKSSKHVLNIPTLNQKTTLKGHG